MLHFTLNIYEFEGEISLVANLRLGTSNITLRLSARLFDTPQMTVSGILPDLRIHQLPGVFRSSASAREKASAYSRSRKKITSSKGCRVGGMRRNLKLSGGNSPSLQSIKHDGFLRKTSRVLKVSRGLVQNLDHEVAWRRKLEYSQLMLDIFSNTIGREIRTVVSSSAHARRSPVWKVKLFPMENGNENLCLAPRWKRLSTLSHLENFHGIGIFCGASRQNQEVGFKVCKHRRSRKNWYFMDKIGCKELWKRTRECCLDKTLQSVAGQFYKND
ncbi:hypothetical protein Tco_1107525 [Tanacetum coccineum]